MTSTFQLPSLSLIRSHKVEKFYVRRIICIGRNYADHAKEIGHQPNEAPPFFFYKPITALVDASSDCKITLPRYSKEVHHELELSIAIGHRPNTSLTTDAIIGCGLALDTTCRDTQQEAKRKGRPWDTAKGFDQSAPCSALKAMGWDDIQQLDNFNLTNNGKLVQSGRHQDMIWSIPQLLEELQNYTRLDHGDLILTGTPAGVAPVDRGDQLFAECTSAGIDLRVTIS